MKRKDLLSIIALFATAVLSAIIIYQTLFVSNIVEEAGLIGIFLSSLFGHLSVIGRNLFVPAFINLTKHYQPFILGFSAGIGAAIGEVTTYYWGLGISKVFQKDRQNNPLSQWMNKYGILALLIVASSPLPDTPIALLAGSSRLSMKKFLIIQIAGKVLYYSLAAALGGIIYAELSNLMGELVFSALIVVASIALCVVTSWSKGREKILQILRKIFP